MTAAFSVNPWPKILAFYDWVIADGGEFVRPMRSLAASIVDEGQGAHIVGHTSMHDLVVTTAPVAEHPDRLHVSLQQGGRVRVEHQPWRGQGDSIDRYVDDLVPLFWRFTIEKWGIHPARDNVIL